jgi:hypothetical protein
LEKIERITYEWIPRKKVGPFVFGSPIKQYIKKYRLSAVPEEYNPKVDWAVYSTDIDDRIYVEEGRIVSVSCSSSFIYKEKELIGIPFGEILSYLNCQPDSVDKAELSDGFQDIYEFDQLGLQLWVKEGDVISAIVNAPAIIRS